MDASRRGLTTVERGDLATGLAALREAQDGGPIHRPRAARVSRRPYAA